VKYARVTVSDQEDNTNNEAAVQFIEPFGSRTMTRIPSHSVVLNDWSLAGGLPGSTARIEAVGSEVGRSLRSESHYTIARSQKDVTGSSDLSCRGGRRRG
jgi:hypothetical protein